MSKTAEEMAEDILQGVGKVASELWGDDEQAKKFAEAIRSTWLAGYKAAQEQLADADKVITYDYVETASNEARELITKFELKNDEDVLVKALVAAYCRGVDAVDGYLRNSLSAYRNFVRRQQWISGKDGKQSHWRAGERPAYFVPQSALLDPTELEMSVKCREL